MGKFKFALSFVALLLVASPAIAQSPVGITAPVGVRTFVTSITLPPDVVSTRTVMQLSSRPGMLDAPAKWDWENVLDSSGFVRSVNVYVTLDPNNTTQAYGKTICCWTYAETSLVVTDVSGVDFAYPLQVTAQ